MSDVAVPKKGRSRKALKSVSSSEINISAGDSSSPLSGVAKEEAEGLTAVISPSKNSKKAPPKSKSSKVAASVPERSFADELLELQGKLEQLQIEKEKAEELLKQRDEILKQKDEEIENRGKAQERLQDEVKKLQKLKEFKPTMNFPLVKSLLEKGEDKNEKKKKKSKGNSCPEMKKPCPAYVSWCRDQWAEVKRESPDADFKEVTNVLGAKWKTLSAEEKKPYEDKYQQEKEAYLQLMKQEKRQNEAMRLLEEEQMQKTAMELLEQYLQFKQEADKEGKKTTKKEKDPLKPKHPMSAFFLFSKERREVLLQHNKNVREISKMLGEEWRNMTEKQKAPYEEAAKDQKEIYNREMELYKQKRIEEAATLEKEEEEQMKVMKQEALQLLKKKEKTDNIIKKTKENRHKKKEQNADPNRPKKPPSSFILFSKETRKQLVEERPGIPNSTMNAMISVKWKELGEREKQMWNEKAAESLDVYKRELEEYNRAAAAAASASATM